MCRVLDIEQTAFTTSLIEPPLRLQIYRKWIRAVSEVHACEDAMLSASMLVFRVGDVFAARSTSSRVRYRRRGDSPVERHLDECILVQFVVRGDVHGRFDGSVLDLGRGDVYLCDLAGDTDLWMDDAEQIHLLMPRRHLSGVKGKIHGRVVPRQSLSCRLLCELLNRLFDVELAAPGERMKPIVEETIELLIRCLNHESHHGSPSDSFERTRQAIMGYIRENLSRPELGTEHLQKTFAISRAKLYRLFADLGGIHRYIRDQRLDAAIRDICRHPKQSIAATAHRYGFSNSRQFQRAVRARFGITARDARTGWGIDSIFKKG